MILRTHLVLNISNPGPRPDIQKLHPIIQPDQIAIIITNGENKQMCKICLQYYVASSFVNPLDCHEFCKGCFDCYLKEQIKIANVINIRCPKDGCTKTFNDIENLLGIKEQIRKYKIFKKRQLLEKDPSVRFCPDYNCGKYVHHDGIQKTVKCECGIQICVNCHLVAHSGRNCNELQIKIDSNTKKRLKIYECPSCKVPIQKDNTCNEMTCHKCNYEFCWICFGQIKGESHWNVYNIFGCPFGKHYKSVQRDPLPCISLLRFLMIIPRIILLILLSVILILEWICLSLLLTVQSFVEFPLKIKNRYIRYCVIVLSLPLILLGSMISAVLLLIALKELLVFGF